MSELEKLRAAMEACGIKTEAPWDIADWTTAEQKWREKSTAELLAAAEAWALEKGCSKGQYRRECKRTVFWGDCPLRSKSEAHEEIADVSGPDNDTVDIIAVTKALEWWKKEGGK